MTIRFLSSLLLLSATLALSACGGGGSGGQLATGDVAVVFTDGPTDQYERILISMDRMTLIGPGGQEDLYNGPEVTFDLLEMSDWADLAFNTKVLAGQYNKIRIYLTKVVLVDTDDPQNNQQLRQLPANGKIDLNPRGPFEVSPDYTTVIKLDMDAKRSFQVVETGNGKLKLRPIIFVDVYQGSIVLPDRLVRVFGTVEPESFENADTSDPSDDSFRLCNLEFISQASGPSLGGPDDCVRVYTDGETSVFDDTGAEVDFSAVTENEPLTAVGFLVDTDDSDAFLGLNGVVLELGDRQPDDADGWSTIQGVVESDPAACLVTPADQCFDFGPDSGDPTVTTRMQAGTRVFRADGIELNQSDVSMDDSGSVDGLPVNTELNAALLVLSTDLGSGIVSGTLDSVTDAAPYTVLNVLTDAGGQVNVCVDPDTSIVRVLVDDEVVTIFDILDPGVLKQGSLVEAFGDADTPPAGCDMVADQVIVEPPLL
ncbi:MAG: DUF4382 domain-containing protein [Gammaproteobacteria bacterium]|nr:MAG: DUF4382 domain-containing protein [Gammaproteobacteria bacterium]